MPVDMQIDELEMELDMEQRRGRDMAAEIKKLQRQLADLRASSQSDHQLVIEYTETISGLEMKLISLKKQLEHSVRRCLHDSVNVFDFYLVNLRAVL